MGSLIFGHPVVSESIMEAAHDVHGLSVHLVKRRNNAEYAQMGQFLSIRHILCFFNSCAS